MPLNGAVGERMIASNLPNPSANLFQGKSQTARDLYVLLLRKLNQIGPVQKTSKAMSVNFENRKVFASVMIRNRSIKLVLTADHKIDSPRILRVEHVAEKDYEHTILLASKADIDDELMKWLGDAYLTSN
jgi:hypothetical protein